MNKKALFSLLLAAVLIALTALPAAALTPIGDMNLSGDITADDARTVLRYAVKLEAPNTSQRKYADVDGDGAITAADARYVMRMAVKLDTPLSVLLYNKAHPYFRCTMAELHPNPTLYERALDSISDWCTYYSLHDVYIPVLKALGYSDAKIAQVAPSNYSSEKLAKAASNTAKLNIPSWMVAKGIPWYVPSLLMNHYLEHPDYAETFIFWDFYDDMVTEQIYHPTYNRRDYRPQVGDFVFMSNKERTYVEVQGRLYPTVDHVAQIIEVYEDGRFLCTEGSIIQSGEDGKARVRERVYDYNYDKETYVFVNNPIVNVLAISRPNLDG